MIELTPKEVEACRRLKQYTEKQLIKELYDAIENPVDDQTKKFMESVREMAWNALTHIHQIVTLLFDSGAKKDESTINKMLQEAGPLSLYYSLADANSDRDAKNQELSDIDDTGDKKIDIYRKNIRKLEEAERKLNKKTNDLLYKISKKGAKRADFDACKLDDAIKDIVSPDIKKIIDSNKKLLKALSKKNKDRLNRVQVIDGTGGKVGYFEVKKSLDLEIVRNYHKIEWQNDYAVSLKRHATSDNCINKLEKKHLAELMQNHKLSPSDCSDIFRLLGTLMEEIAGLDEDDWKKINQHVTEAYAPEKLNYLDQLKFSIQLQSLLRETSGLDIKGLFPQMPSKLANVITMPEKYQIDAGEKFVKFCEKCRKDNPELGAKDVSTIDGDQNIELWYECGNHPGVYKTNVTMKDYNADSYSDSIACQDLQCIGEMKLIYIKFLPLEIGYDRRGKNWECLKHGGNQQWLLTDRIAQNCECSICNNKAILYFKPAKHSKEKPAEHNCPNCNKETKYKPAGGIKPFWKDEIRSRWRDTWSGAFILKYNSIVRAIDRTFGLAEIADISGTTADSIFGMEAAMALGRLGEQSFGTGEDQHELIVDKDLNWSASYRDSAT